MLVGFISDFTFKSKHLELEKLSKDSLVIFFLMLNFDFCFVPSLSIYLSSHFTCVIESTSVPP